jgi:hypothetical protein
MPDTTSIAAFWQLACSSAMNHASSMAHGCRSEAASLIQRETEAFCSREPPATQQELNSRQQQSLYLLSKIGAISHADLMARSHPNASASIMKAVRDFLDRVGTDKSPYSESMALTSIISQLCHADMMRRT